MESSSSRLTPTAMPSPILRTGCASRPRRAFRTQVATLRRVEGSRAAGSDDGGAAYRRGAPVSTGPGSARVTDHHECKAALLVESDHTIRTRCRRQLWTRPLSMPLAERLGLERHDALFCVLSHNDIQHWADRFLARAGT